MRLKMEDSATLERNSTKSFQGNRNLGFNKCIWKMQIQQKIRIAKNLCLVCLQSIFCEFRGNSRSLSDSKISYFKLIRMKIRFAIYKASNFVVTYTVLDIPFSDFRDIVRA